MLGRQLVYISLLTILFVGNKHENQARADNINGFVKTSGTRFFVNGHPFYSDGFNAYWLMLMASDPSQRVKVTSVFQKASSFSLNVARTWAFSDGGFKPLQKSPGLYNEDMFKGLDFVIAEAKKYGIYLILSLVNNYNNFGGRSQYVQWARERGENVSSDDDFYRNAVIRNCYKNHVQIVLNRVNTFTGVAYKDDETVFAWELINEPRCQSDLSGKMLQGWITEMATKVKSIDRNHLLEIGLEGFYGDSMPDRKKFNPGGLMFGTDFISNNQISGIDFATIHTYPDQWLTGSDFHAQINFLKSWTQTHISDSNSVLRKPLLVTEFGKNTTAPGTSITQRDTFYSSAYDLIYASASGGGSGCGALFWQWLADGMDQFRDGYEVVICKSPSTALIISSASHKLIGLDH